jgi:excisionase family DNA binding protein
VEKEVFTVKEVAEFLQLSERSLYKLARKGAIPGKKVLNKWRFERDALKKWLNNGETTKHQSQP